MVASNAQRETKMKFLTISYMLFLVGLFFGLSSTSVDPKGEIDLHIGRPFPFVTVQCGESSYWLHWNLPNILVLLLLFSVSVWIGVVILKRQNSAHIIVGILLLLAAVILATMGFWV